MKRQCRKGKEDTVNPVTDQIRTFLLPNRAVNQPVIGVPTAVAIMLKVTISAISSVVADSAPLI
jgi:hypothetical protein